MTIHTVGNRKKDIFHNTLENVPTKDRGAFVVMSEKEVLAPGLSSQWHVGPGVVD